jgi:NAD(P)-dependent dehydrogenase (short-subunit alcohol dehydrogenase family)
MSAMASLVRFVRPATDPLALFSFNRVGFELNRRGFRADDLPRDAGGRIALVTGANSGIGRATSVELARRGFDVWMLCRDPGRGAAARDAIARECGEDRVHLAVVDMSSLASIRRFVREFSPGRVDVLVHNAGVLPHARHVTDDGVELTFATNVLGPFALTGLLFERLCRSTDARVIFVASGGLYLQRLDLSMLSAAAGGGFGAARETRFDGTRAYAHAKRAQVVLAHLLAERFSKELPITFASMHPGWADTTAVRTSLPRFYSVMRHLLRSADEGADTVVWLAASDRAKGTGGAFWFDRRLAPEYPFPWTRESPDARRELYALCERLSGVTFETVRNPISGGA